MTKKQLCAICAVGVTSCVIAGSIAVCVVSLGQGVACVINKVTDTCTQTVTGLVDRICNS